MAGFEVATHGRFWVATEAIPSFVREAYRLVYSPFHFYRPAWIAKRDQIIANARPAAAVRSDSTVCIVDDAMMRYAYYEAACTELGVPYDVIRMADDKWLQAIKNRRYDVIFFRPFVLTSYGKRIYDDNAYLLYLMGMNLFPSFNDLWIYESKRRSSLIMALRDIPHPESHFFFDFKEAIRFIETVELPVVFKTDLGSEASGVVIVDNREQGRKLVRKCFKSGFVNNYLPMRPF